MDKKEDVRITRSKRDLRNAFIELIKSRPFEKIAVTDICKAAMINKMTFYKHYQDKYALLNDYSKMYALYGCQNNTYKNWETSTVPYTAEDYARFEAEFNS